MKYCDDANCEKFEGGECAFGFYLKFRLPKSIADTFSRNWGYIMPKICRLRLGMKKGEFPKEAK